MNPKLATQNEWMARLTSPAALSVLLGLAALALYWPAMGFEFSHYDDLTYYVENDRVQSGLGWNGLIWAFCTGTASNWHPLTWLSLMADADLGSGPTDAWVPHFTNILLHALNAGLLFWVLWRATQAKWRSLLVAGLFAVHPLNVESVAWVVERKNVLCMFFFLVSLLAYVKAMTRLRFATARQEMENGGKSTPSPVTRHPSRFLWPTLFFFALALMSKPMAVTLPFVLLLLDWWPLGRIPKFEIRNPNLKRLLVEKWAFFLLSAAACLVTYLVQQHGNAVQSAAHFPAGGRIENAVVSYARYLGKTFWPVNLAVYYPHPGHWPATTWCAAAALVVLLSAGTVWCGRRFPFLPMGWFWFLGTLVPVIGLVQAGTQAMADRYAYLPLVGIFIAAVWGGGNLVDWIACGCLHEPERGLSQSAAHGRGNGTDNYRGRRAGGALRVGTTRAPIFRVAFLAGGIILLAEAAVARHQLNFWHNDGALFGHALAVTEKNALAEVTYGVYLEKINQPAEAAKHYRAALAIDPNDKNAHFNLGNILDDEGQTEESISEYRAAIRADPAYYPAAYNLALVLERLGRRDEAIAEYKAVLQIKPDFAAAKQHLQGLGVSN